MAGDWIKFQVSTPDKPEVWQIADKLGIDPDAVVGKLLRVWAWFDEQTTDGNASNVTSVTAMSLLDRRVGVAGFCEAMIFAGWMMRDGDKISLPNFDRHNGRSAKNRANAAERQQKYRESRSQNSNGDTVTDAVTNALPEKRREEKSIIKENKQKKAEKPKAVVVTIPDGVNPQHWEDWLFIRKRKRASPLTVTVMESIVREAKNAGISLAEAIKISAEREWLSFKADWLAGSSYQKSKPSEEKYDQL